MSLAAALVLALGAFVAVIAITLVVTVPFEVRIIEQVELVNLSRKDRLFLKQMNVSV